MRVFFYIVLCLACIAQFAVTGNAGTLIFAIGAGLAIWANVRYKPNTVGRFGGLYVALAFMFIGIVTQAIVVLA